jgi:hypothetical protein
MRDLADVQKQFRTNRGDDRDGHREFMYRRPCGFPGTAKPDHRVPVRRW